MFSPIPFLSEAGHAIIDTNTNEYLPCMKIFVHVELTILQYVTFVVTNCCFSSSIAVQAGCCFNAIEIYSVLAGEQSVMLWELKLLGAFYMISERVLFKNEFIPVAT